MMRLRNPFFAAILTLSVGTGTAKLSLTPNPSDLAQPVGTTIDWIASRASFATWRFEVENPDKSVTILRDYDMYPEFSWTTPLEEGNYTVKVLARDACGEEEAEETFHVTSRVTGESAVISQTNHPLVALYSAPCHVGQKLRVQFRPASSSKNWVETPLKSCGSLLTVNFLVAGMMNETEYKMRHVEAGGEPSPIDTFTTGTPEINPPVPVVKVKQNPSQEGVILSAAILAQRNFLTCLPPNVPPLACPYATDLEGNLLWYYKEPALPQTFGSMVGTVPSPSGDRFITMLLPRPVSQDVPGPAGQILREIDFAGNTLCETNVDRVNEMLRKMNPPKRGIHWFHHDTRYLNNGHLLVMAGVERLVTNVQGNGTVDMVGDMILDLDESFTVVWAWDSTDDHPKLPLSRRALRNEPCGPCGPLRLDGQATEAHDWTHGNALTYTPDDKNVLISFRHMDWVIKNDYQDGNGSGDILWVLGNEGDFEVEQKGQQEDYPWFSRQHQPMFYENNEPVVYDNANAQNEPPPPQGEMKNSRGMVYHLDEQEKISELIVTTDLGVFSPFLGSAQKLSNNNYHFLSGVALDPSFPPPPGSPFPTGSSESSEVHRSSGKVIYTLKIPGVVSYRSFRMMNLYEMDEPQESEMMSPGEMDEAERNKNQRIGRRHKKTGPVRS